jgi:prepilin-type N-terminal cleavage/methylation domain-containing protein
MKSFFKKLKNRKSGFTLVELIVATSIFVIAVSLATGIFVRTLRMQSSIMNMMEVQSNASIVLEQIAREIRGGFEFQPTNSSPQIPCGSYFDTLSFRRVRQTGAIRVAIRWNDTDKRVEREESGSGMWVPLTASNVRVDRLCFWLNPDPTPDPNPSTRDNPWRITIFLTIGSTNRRLAAQKFKIQTTVSARLLPLELSPQTNH